MNLRAFGCVLPFLVASALAQNDGKAPDKPGAAKAPFVFEAGIADLRDVIARCGAYLQRNILVDEGELVTGGGQRPARRAPAAGGAPAAADAGSGSQIELQLPIVTDANGCEDLLTSLLWSRGLALTPLDEARGVYEVLALHGARGREVSMRAVQRTPEQVLARPALRQFVTVVVALQHTNATIATNALRPFFASTGAPSVGSLQIGNVGNSTAIVLTGPQDQCANAIQLLRMADVPEPPEPKRSEPLAQSIENLSRRLAALEEKVGKAK